MARASFDPRVVGKTIQPRVAGRVAKYTIVGPTWATVAHATHKSVGVRSGRKCLTVPLDAVTA